MDYERAARELVRALRGRHSQTAARRRLGRTSNVLHAWETGTRYPGAADFLRLLQVSGRPPLPLLNRFAPCRGGSLRAIVSSWLSALTRDRPQADLARLLNVNRNTVARWLSGATEPRLPKLLAFIELTTQRSLDFIAQIVDPKDVPSISLAFRDLEQQRALAYDFPWAHAVLRALELETYRALPQHEPGFIARSTGITLEQEEHCLRVLLRAKQIRRRRGLFRVARVLAVDTRDDPAKNLALKRHWFEVASERLRADGIPQGGLASYNLFAISDGDLERLRQAHLDYYERLRAIVAECKHPTRVVLATLDLIPLDRRALQGE
jgi:transcriptional regulator with XRE-family HTH domain